MTDDQFTKLTNQIADVRDSLGDQMLKLYQHFDQRLDVLEANMNTKTDGERVYTALDGIAKRLDTDEQERAAMNHQLSRHERWHHQEADKLGMKLNYQE